MLVDDDIAPFMAFQISREASRRVAAGHHVIRMEFGQPAAGAPAGAIAAAQEALARNHLPYWESWALRERIAAHYRASGLDVDPHRIILTGGASPALLLAFTTVFRPDDRVALARPGYVAYRNTLRTLSMCPQEIPCGADVGFQVTANAIAALDPPPAGLLIASPANPTGTIIDPAELDRIAGVCRERSIRIVSDEIYHGLTYGKPARSVLEVAPDALVVNGFSKYFCMTGWRLGWLVVPADLVRSAEARSGHLFLTPPTLAQHAALAAFDCQDELRGHLATYARNRDLLLDALPAMGLARVAPPDGAFYLYADVSHLTDDSLALCLEILDATDVAVAPGVDFDPVDGGRFIRFCFALSTADIREAIARLTTWFQSSARRSI